MLPADGAAYFGYALAANARFAAIGVPFALGDDTFIELDDEGDPIIGKAGAVYTLVRERDPLEPDALHLMTRLRETKLLPAPPLGEVPATEPP